MLRGSSQPRPNSKTVPYRTVPQQNLIRKPCSANSSKNLTRPGVKMEKNSGVSMTQTPSSRCTRTGYAALQFRIICCTRLAKTAFSNVNFLSVCSVAEEAKTISQMHLLLPYTPLRKIRCSLLDAMILELSISVTGGIGVVVVDSMSWPASGLKIFFMPFFTELNMLLKYPLASAP